MFYDIQFNVGFAYFYATIFLHVLRNHVSPIGFSIVRISAGSI